MSVVAEKPETKLPPYRLAGRSTSASIERIGLKQQPFSDLYHFLLTASWSRVLASIAALYLGLNAVFALGYLAIGDGIENARPGSYSDAFFFSVQTMATIGYGKMVPHSLTAHVLVTIEALIGMVGVAMASGLMFAKFARPTGRVLFSHVAVIGPHDGVPTLSFRAANQRKNQIVEAQLRVVFARDERTKEGAFMRRFYDLTLARSSSIIFALTWTVMHRVDDASPLFGATRESLQAANAELIVSLTGIDDTFSQTVHARWSYLATDLVFGARFVDVLEILPTGKRRVDYSRFHDHVALSERKPAGESR
jgi:inward rectifier potassium channel